MPDGGGRHDQVRTEIDDDGSLSTLWRRQRSKIFFPGAARWVDFMKYPACRGAPAPDMPDGGDPATYQEGPESHASAGTRK